MTARKRRKGRRGGKGGSARWWPWVLGAAIGAVLAYFFVPRRAPQSIPSPGEAARTAIDALPTEARSENVPAVEKSATRPREEIHDHERQALDRVLRERSH